MSTETDIIEKYRTLAVVGLSSDERRESNSVSRYMQEHGYRIIPVNPDETEVLGEKAFANVASLPEAPDVVLVFRRPEFVPEIVEQAIAVGAKAVWMQEGIVHEGAAARARDAGLEVVMDRCIRSVHRKLGSTA